MEELVFTPAAVLDLLSKIDELKDVDVGITETMDGQIQLQVGESTYEIDTEEATDIQVDKEVVEEISDTNQQAYDDLAESGEVEINDTVESGIIKEVAKTLLVGGIARLGVNLLRN